MISLQGDLVVGKNVAAEDSNQEDIFEIVGKPIVDQCLNGYNGSIFAYG